MTDITANVVVSMPSQLFTMARSFKAVANGKIYIGKIDTDPVNPENRIQVYVENEDGSHIPVSQPIIINAAGYPVYNGQIAKFVTVQGHSMAVYDAYGAQQFYFPNVLKYDPDQFSHYAKNVFSYGRFKKLHPFTFQTGATINNENEALFDSVTGMFYVYKNFTSPVIVPPESSPNSNWLCVGILAFYEVGDLRNFKGVGDGVTDNTGPVNRWLDYAKYFSSSINVPDGVFISGPVQIEDVDGVTISGTGTLKMIGGRTGALYYADGALLTFINSTNIVVSGVTFDGNRTGSPLYTGFNHSLQFVTGTGDFRSNNGGRVKPNRNIKVYRCKFKNTGSYNASIDKFGDGIYLFGCDGVDIDQCYFENMGRWGIAASDVLNVRFTNLVCNNSEVSATSLGFINIENESTDNVNGSYSESIFMSNLSGIGLCQILVGAGSNSENKDGAYHYLKNIFVNNASLMMVDGPDYATNYIGIGVAPFCHVAPTVGVVDNSNISFDHCKVICQTPGTKIAFGINAQGIGGSNIVKNISFTNCVSNGAQKGFQGSADISSGGYSFRNITITGTYDVSGINSIGCRLSATQLVDFMISVRSSGSTQRALSIEDGRDIGVIDTYGLVYNCSLNAASGVNAFAYISRSSFVGVLCHGGATQADLTVNTIDKDYGNTWNTLRRTIPEITFSTTAITQKAYGGIDLGRHVKLGYAVTAAPPFIMDQLTWSAYVTDPGIGILIVQNMTGTTVSKASDVWTITVEKR